MIKIKANRMADSRTCDVSKVSSEQLLNASLSHIDDVRQGIDIIINSLKDAGRRHDFTKIMHHDEFYKDFKVKFATQDWYDLHKKTERHHLESPDGVREDVDLVDVIECVVDCVMAGLARSGKIRPIKIPAEVLLRAVQNTANSLALLVEVTK